MTKKLEGWEVSAVLWIDACADMDDVLVRPVPVLSFGVVVPSEDRKFKRVVAEITGIRGGSGAMVTAIPPGMSPRIIKLAHLPIPEEFQDYWNKIA
jgi:hypothetical protein